MQFVTKNTAELLAIPASEIFTSSSDEDYLGSGSFGTVYRCYCSQLGVIAVKSLRLCGSAESIERRKNEIKNEIEILQRMETSQYVTAVYGVTVCKPCVGILLEYVPGGNLTDLLAGSADVPWNIRIRIMYETAAGMTHLHGATFDKRVTHNDLKPDNILLDNDFHVKICDLGGANLAPYTSKASVSSSTNSSNTYTVYYAAPEFLRDSNQRRSRAMDVYSYGMTVFYVLTQQHPFNKLESTAIEHKVAHGDKPSFNLKKIKAGVDDVDGRIIETLVGVMTDCWGTSPKERPTIKLVGDELSNAVNAIPENALMQTVKRLRSERPLKPESQQCDRISLVSKWGLEEKFSARKIVEHEVNHHEAKASNSNYGAPVPHGAQARESYGNAKATCSTYRSSGKNPIAIRGTQEIDLSSFESVRFDKDEEISIKTSSSLYKARIQKIYKSV